MNYKIVAKYIKDLKFEIPNPKTFFLLEKNISNYKINIDIKSNQFKDKIIEVETTLTLNPNTNDFEKINTTIVFFKYNSLKSIFSSILILLKPDFSNNKTNKALISG